MNRKLCKNIQLYNFHKRKNVSFRYHTNRKWVTHILSYPVFTHKRIIYVYSFFSVSCGMCSFFFCSFGFFSFRRSIPFHSLLNFPTWKFVEWNMIVVCMGEVALNIQNFHLLGNIILYSKQDKYVRGCMYVGIIWILFGCHMDCVW